MKVFILLLLASLPFYAQDRQEGINLIEGKWKLDNAGFTLIEEWIKVNETTFQGSSYPIENNEKNISEKVYILKLDDHIVYIAQPQNSLPVLFTLISSDKNKFIFENKEHDFPQRVIYHFTSDSTLTASIEGEVLKQPERKEFLYIRIK